jgi:glycosyltransferase involved in cell wall biosynthesis
LPHRSGTEIKRRFDLPSVLVSLEDHLWRANDGRFYVDGPADYSLWSQLLKDFDQVVLLARVGKRNLTPDRGKPVDGPSVSISALPDYLGPSQYLFYLPVLQPRVQRAVAKSDHFILRVPGLVGRLAWRAIRRSKKKYAVEVMGDPWDAFGPGTMPSPFRPGYRQIASRNMKAICRGAVAALYWNNSVLPRRYPTGNGSYVAVSPSLAASNGFASDDLMGKRSNRILGLRSFSNGEGENTTLTTRVGFVGSLAQLYKGPDTLLRAISLLHKDANLKVLIVGGGRYRRMLEVLANQLAISQKVNFLGQLKSGSGVFDFLDSIDLFVMPSRAEGFPRALHEAMSRGCPCIGSNVGGIPELLVPEDIVPPNDPKALAKKIMEVTADPERMKAMSERNLARARQFDPETLLAARRKFYQYVRDHSANNGKSGSEAQA